MNAIVFGVPVVSVLRLFHILMTDEWLQGLSSCSVRLDVHSVVGKMDVYSGKMKSG